MKRSLLYALGLCAISVLAYASVGGWRSDHSGSQAITPHTLAPIEVQATVLERGWVSSRKRVPVMSQIHARLESVPENGQVVKAGDKLFVLSEDEVRQDIKNIENAIEDRKSDLKRLKREYDATNKEYSATLRSQRQNLTHAKIVLASLKEPLSADDRRALEIDIALAKLDMEDTKEALDRESRLLKKNFVSKLQFESKQRAYHAAKAYFDELVVKLALREKGEAPEKIIEAEQLVARAQSVLERREAKRQRALHKIQLDIDSAKLALRNEERKLARDIQKLKHTIITSPVDGVVQLRLRRDWSRGGQWIPLRPGREMWENDILADIIDPSVVQIEMMVHESDFNRLKEGMAVSIRLPALPGKQFAGRLSYLAALGRDKQDLAPLGQVNSRADQTFFKALVDLDSAGQGFNVGMSAMVEVTLDAPQSRLLIPRSIVVVADDGLSVYKKQGSRWVRTAISGEVYNAMYFLPNDSSELKAGDVVALNAHALSAQRGTP